MKGQSVKEEILKQSTNTPKTLQLSEKIYELRWDLWDSSLSPQDPQACAMKHVPSEDIYNQDVYMCFGVIVIYYWSIL